MTQSMNTMQVCVCVCVCMHVEEGRGTERERERENGNGVHGDHMATISKLAGMNTSDHVWLQEVTTLGLSKTMVAALLQKNLSAKNMGCVSFVTLLDSCCIRRSLVLLHSIYSIYYLFIKCGSISFKR